MSRALVILTTDAMRERVVSWARKAPAGTRVEFKAPKRSVEQNAMLWACLTEVAKQTAHCGRKYTPAQWKVLFMHALGQEVEFLPALDGKTFVPFNGRSSEMTVTEMGELLEFILAWGAQNGVTFKDIR